MAMAARYQRLGLIAGGGELPVHVATAAQAENRLGCVITLDGFGEADRYGHAVTLGIGQIGAIFDALKSHQCDAVCFAGIVARPDFTKLRPDMKGIGLLPKVLAAATRGDDALLRCVVEIFEKEGLSVVGAEEISDALKARLGVLGKQTPSDQDRSDAFKAMHVAGVIGSEDIGQGAVVCDGLVLAVEAQEGTDRMLARVAELPAALRGNARDRKGVLAKRPKPVQERRVDLPVIGLSTIRGVAHAGLAGIVVPAGGALILGAEAVAEAADRSGVFVWVVDEAIVSAETEGL